MTNPCMCILGTEERRVNELAGSRLDFQLVTEDGFLLDTTLLVTLTVTLSDKATSAIINGRDRTSILNSAGGFVLPDLNIVSITQQIAPIVTVDDTHYLRDGDSVQLFGTGEPTLDSVPYTVEVVSPTAYRLAEANTSRISAVTTGTSRSGKVLWEMLGSDNPIVGTPPLNTVEEHIALLEWKYTNPVTGFSRDGKLAVQIDVLNLDHVPAT